MYIWFVMMVGNLYSLIKIPISKYYISNFLRNLWSLKLPPYTVAPLNPNNCIKYDEWLVYVKNPFCLCIALISIITWRDCHFPRNVNWRTWVNALRNIYTYNFILTRERKSMNYLYKWMKWKPDRPSDQLSYS